MGTTCDVNRVTIQAGLVILQQRPSKVREGATGPFRRAHHTEKTNAKAPRVGQARGVADCAVLRPLKGL